MLGAQLYSIGVFGKGSNHHSSQGVSLEREEPFNLEHLITQNMTSAKEFVPF